jgi:hypothetical protein
VKVLVNKKPLIIAILFLLFTCLGENHAFAISQTKLTATDGAAGDDFGRSVSINTEIVVVGARNDDDSGDFSGSAYVFKYNGATWVEEAKLTASDAAEGDGFGCSVSISGETVVVGANGDDDAGNNSGSAYVFNYNGATWVEEAKLTASDAAEGDGFGFPVSISGETVVVGAYFDDDAGNNSGSAYVFKYNGATWVEEAKLTASDAAANDYFGLSVSISSETVVVGAYENDDAGNGSGSAYVFKYNGATWVEETKLTASDAAAYDSFGISVSNSGETVVVGANGDDDAGNGSGSVYVFRYNGTSWVEEAKLTASDAAAGDVFGTSVSIGDEIMTVGADFDDNAGYDSGSAYVFKYNGTSWVEEAKLTASDAAAGDWFGHSVSISGETVVVGAYGDDNAGSRSGSAYVFMMPPSLTADFGPSGLYTYDGATWDRINSLDPAGLGAYASKLVANFPGLGLHEYDGTDWKRINTNDGAENMAAAGSNLYVDFGTVGLYRYNGSSWGRIVRRDASALASFDGKLAVTFPGRGLYVYDGGWSRITNNDTAQTMIGLGSMLYVEFSNGLWEYNGSSFSRLTRWEVSSLATYDGKLAVNFPGRGLYEYDGSWSRITKNDTAEGMCGVGTSLYVDFGAIGLYRYDGSNFQRVSTSDCEDMVAAELP